VLFCEPSIPNILDLSGYLEVGLGAFARGVTHYSIVMFLTTTSLRGTSFGPTFTPSIFVTTSIPSITLPNIEYSPSRKSAPSSGVTMKNWLAFEFLSNPFRAIERAPCTCFRPLLVSRTTVVPGPS